MEIVDRLDVQTFGPTNVLEDIPVGTGWSLRCVSVIYGRRCQYSRALKEGDKEAGCIQRDRIEQHDVAEPFVQTRRKDAFAFVST